MGVTRVRPQQRFGGQGVGVVPSILKIKKEKKSGSVDQDITKAHRHQ